MLALHTVTAECLFDYRALVFSAYSAWQWPMVIIEGHIYLLAAIGNYQTECYKTTNSCISAVFKKLSSFSTV